MPNTPRSSYYRHHHCSNGYKPALNRDDDSASNGYDSDTDDQTTTAHSFGGYDHEDPAFTHRGRVASHRVLHEQRQFQRPSFQKECCGRPALRHTDVQIPNLGHQIHQEQPFELKADKSQLLAPYIPNPSFSEDALLTLSNQASDGLKDALNKVMLRSSGMMNTNQSLKNHIYHHGPFLPSFEEGDSFRILIIDYAAKTNYEQFVKRINIRLKHLVRYLDRLERNADYTVATTANPKEKRCWVGRPRGKILKPTQGDDFKNRLCYFHADKVGFEIQEKLHEGEEDWDPFQCPDLGDD